MLLQLSLLVTRLYLLVEKSSIFSCITNEKWKSSTKNQVESLTQVEIH